MAKIAKKLSKYAKNCHSMFLSVKTRGLGLNVFQSCSLNFSAANKKKRKKGAKFKLL